MNDTCIVLCGWINNKEKEDNLVELINKIRSLCDYPIIFSTHYPLNKEIQKKIDYYIYDKNNNILTIEEYIKMGTEFRFFWWESDYFKIISHYKIRPEYAILENFKNAFNFAKFLNIENIIFIESDTIIEDDFIQLHRESLEQYLYCRTPYQFVKKDINCYRTNYFSIKTDLIIHIINKIKTKKEYWELVKKECKTDLFEYVFNYLIEKEIDEKNIYTTNKTYKWRNDSVTEEDFTFSINKKQGQFIFCPEGEKIYFFITSFDDCSIVLSSIENNYSKNIIKKNITSNDYNLFLIGLKKDLKDFYELSVDGKIVCRFKKEEIIEKTLYNKIIWKNNIDENTIKKNGWDKEVDCGLDENINIYNKIKFKNVFSTQEDNGSVFPKIETFLIDENINRISVKIYYKDLKNNLTIHSDCFVLEKDFGYYSVIYSDISLIDGIRVDIVDVSTGDIIFREDKKYRDFNKVIVYSCPDDRCWYQYYDVFYKKSYQHRTKNGTLVKVDDGDICLDIGANLGFFSMFAVEEGAKTVYAIEPCSKTCLYLEQNVDKNKVKITQKAMCGSNGNRKMTVSDTFSGGNYISEFPAKDSRTDTYTIDVDSIGINDFIKQNNIPHINFIKINCEGSEYEIFESFEKEYLQKHVDKIIGEYHCSYNGEIDKLEKKLRDCGFDFEYYPSSIEDKNWLGKFVAWKNK